MTMLTYINLIKTSPQELDAALAGMETLDADFLRLLAKKNFRQAKIPVGNTKLRMWLKNEVFALFILNSQDVMKLQKTIDSLLKNQWQREEMRVNDWRRKSSRRARISLQA